MTEILPCVLFAVLRLITRDQTAKTLYEGKSMIRHMTTEILIIRRQNWCQGSDLIELAFRLM